ncbi:hypothetical protein ACFFX0_16265 [Citricoccus parietis]|uniref:Uncharacterized protein n=1 Tax=Citricoccus parietis TaxID=592307 RepID=A0ABV5G157_9MICC
MPPAAHEAGPSRSYGDGPSTCSSRHHPKPPSAPPAMRRAHGQPMGRSMVGPLGRPAGGRLSSHRSGSPIKNPAGSGYRGAGEHTPASLREPMVRSVCGQRDGVGRGASGPWDEGGLDVRWHRWPV